MGEYEDYISSIPFSGLVDECMAKGIKVTKKDTEETLREKLMPQASSKRHSHSYRKDGTCACGATRKAKE